MANLPHVGTGLTGDLITRKHETVPRRELLLTTRRAIDLARCASACCRI
jgi:hypothetical protein